MAFLGKELKLIEKTTLKTDELPETVTPEAPTALDVLVHTPENGVPPAPRNGRHARDSREDSVGVEPVAVGETAPENGDSSEAVGSNRAASPDRESRRVARAEKRRRPRAPLAEKVAAPSDSSTLEEREGPDDLLPPTDDLTAPGEALAVDLSSEKAPSRPHAARRARAKQEQAAEAMKDADDHPAIGALNRHLNMLTQQLGTAHRVIGRLAAERDEFRQQLADLQGIPVDAIPVTSVEQTQSRRSRAPVGKSADPSGGPVAGIAVASPKQPHSRRARAADADADAEEPSPPTGMARLNYFSVDDIAVARKRRQTAALALLVVVVGLWLASRMGAWQLPNDLSRESLAHLPVIGELMSYFLAGWVLYRVVRVGGKGVKWVFPSDDKKHRRR